MKEIERNEIERKRIEIETVIEEDCSVCYE
jgi:hypothetical protein